MVTCRTPVLLQCNEMCAISVNKILTKYCHYLLIRWSCSTYCTVRVEMFTTVDSELSTLFTRMCSCHEAFVSFHLASSVDIINSSHMNTSSLASWSSCNPPSDFINMNMCRQYGLWSAAGHSRMSMIWRDHICAGLHDTGFAVFQVYQH